MVKEVNAFNVAKWFSHGLWSAAMVDDAVTKGKLTSAEAEKIKKLPVKTQ